MFLRVLVVRVGGDNVTRGERERKCVCMKKKLQSFRLSSLAVFRPKKKISVAVVYLPALIMSTSFNWSKNLCPAVRKNYRIQGERKTQIK